MLRRVRRRRARTRVDPTVGKVNPQLCLLGLRRLVREPLHLAPQGRLHLLRRRRGLGVHLRFVVLRTRLVCRVDDMQADARLRFERLCFGCDEGAEGGGGTSTLLLQ